MTDPAVFQRALGIMADRWRERAEWRYVSTPEGHAADLIGALERAGIVLVDAHESQGEVTIICWTTNPGSHRECPAG